jgi:hypothetical protein
MMPSFHDGSEKCAVFAFAIFLNSKLVAKAFPENTKMIEIKRVALIQ